MRRKLFCEISPFTYLLSVKKERLKRYIKDWLAGFKFAKSKGEPLPVEICKHSSLIRRKFGIVNMTLQENKAINLAIAAPLVNRILIKPDETFSFWGLVGRSTKAKGYRESSTLSCGNPSRVVGGGMCHLTNLLHFMVLHSPLDIVEYHHHNHLDLFSDYGRQEPFGLETSVLYNYLDYRVKNNTANTFQFIVYTSPTHICGQLRASDTIEYSYHIVEEDKHFIQIGEDYYRRNKVYRNKIDKKTGLTVEKLLLASSDAKVLYDSELIPKGFLHTT